MQILDSNYRNYKMLERSLLQSKSRLMGKLPEIQKAEEAVDLLIRKRDTSENVGNCTPRCTVPASLKGCMHFLYAAIVAADHG